MSSYVFITNVEHSHMSHKLTDIYTSGRIHTEYCMHLLCEQFDIFAPYDSPFLIASSVHVCTHASDIYIYIYIYIYKYIYINIYT
jgi:hypothetical protein